MITFTDYPTFSLNITIDPNSEFEFGSINIKSVLPAEVSYMSFQRPDRDDFAIHNTLLDVVEFAFDSIGEYSKVFFISPFIMPSVIITWGEKKESDCRFFVF